MPPPPVMPPPANTFAYPPNFELYARAHALRWAQRILLDEFGEAARRGGDDDEKTSDDDDRSPGQSPEKETTTKVSNGVEELVADAGDVRAHVAVTKKARLERRRRASTTTRPTGTSASSTCACRSTSS